MADREELPVARERMLVVSDISLAASGRVLPPTEMEQMLGELEA